MRPIVFSLVLFVATLAATSAPAETREQRPARAPAIAWEQVRPASLEKPLDHLAATAPFYVSKVPLAAALEQLAAYTNLQLIYSPSILQEVLVSCACDAADVPGTLDALLSGTEFRWVASGRQILIERRPRPQVASMAASPVSTSPSVRVGTITGRVVEAGTLRPLAGAQVLVVGTTLGTLAGGDGRFILLNVPDGAATVRVQMIGFGTTEQAVTVQPGASATVDFQLQQEALALDAVVVTGTAGATRRRELGNAVTQLDATIAETQPIQNVSDLLRGRATGVVIQRAQGAVGSASTIKIRGSSTLRLVNDGPLIYIDGVRVNNSMTDVGGPDVSRIDDLDPANIERVEIIKGPAAATLYGTEAANGVIQIITKRGSLEGTTWNVTTRQGANMFRDAEGHTPLNWGVNPETGQVESLNLVAAEDARGTPIFSAGHSQYYGMDVSGGSGIIRYFMSGSAALDEGVTPDNWAKKYNAQVNVSASPRENLTVSANSGFGLIRMRLPDQGSGLNTMMNSMFLGGPEHLGGERRGFQQAPPEAYYEAVNLSHEATRATLGLTVDHRPLAWLNHRLTFGIDATDQVSTEFTPRLTPYAAQFYSAGFARGSKEMRRESVLYTTFDYGASATRGLSESLSSTTSAGFQVYTKATDRLEASGEGFPVPALRSIGGTSTRQGTDDVIENNTVGVYLQQQLGWRDRAFLTAAVRADDNSAFGEDFDLVYYPKVSGSWVVSDESFWRLGFVNSFRLRAAYGESGQQPDAFDALRTYVPANAPDGSTVFPDTPGNSELGPERGQEIEAGFDASFLNDRVTLGFTYYDQTTKDAIVARNVAPSSGFDGTQFVNVGEVSNRGVEVDLNTRLLERQGFSWDLDVNVATNRNRIVDLGGAEYLQLGWTTRHAKGYPVGSFFALDIVDAELDAEGNAINVLCGDGLGGAVDCNEAPMTYAGHPDPNVEGSVSTSFGIGSRLQLQALVDYKLGHSKFSTGMWWRVQSLRIDEINYFPERYDPIEVAAAQSNLGDTHYWIPKANFARLREVSLNYSVPGAWVERFGASGGRLGLAARNLGVWTNYLPYPYQDPETMNASGTFSGNREPEDTGSLPPLTSLELTLQLTF